MALWREINSSYFCTGFVGPDGEFYPVLPCRHDEWAEENYGCDREQLIKYHGFVEIYQHGMGSTIIASSVFGPARLTEAQIETISKFPIDDWDDEAKELLRQ